MVSWDDDAPQYVNSDERKVLAAQAAQEAKNRRVLKKKEARARRLRKQFVVWGLTPAEERLFLVLDDVAALGRDLIGIAGAAELEEKVIAQVYGVTPGSVRPGGNASKKRRCRKYRARLRQLEHRLKAKLSLAGVPYRIERPQDGWLRLADTRVKLQDARPARRPVPTFGWEECARIRLATRGPMPVGECEWRLLKLLAAGPMPKWKVMQALAAEGCRTGTLKTARKHLGIIARREGYGGNGEWLLSLPRRDASAGSKCHRRDHSVPL